MKRCNHCDARGKTDRDIRHALGCPFRSDQLACKHCGRVGEHAPRCPYVKQTRGRSVG